MESFDCVRITHLVVIYILDTLGRIFDLNQIGFYRDDGFIFILNSNGPKTSQLQKKIRVFRSQGLRNEISSNLKIVNILDVTFNLDNNSFYKSSHVFTYLYQLKPPLIYN